MSQQDDLIRFYGIMTQGYGAAWPDLKAQLMAIYEDRVSRIPWLPSDWLSTVRLVNDVSTNVVVVVPSTATRTGGAGAEFLDTPEKVQWWNELAASASSAVQKYAAGKAADGKAQLDRLYAASDFWSRAYDWAVILASPVTALRTIWNNPYATAYTVAGLGVLWWLFTRPRRGRK